MVEKTTTSVFIINIWSHHLKTIDENGIRIEGSKADWMYGILPDKPYEGVKSCIEDRTIIF